MTWNGIWTICLVALAQAGCADDQSAAKKSAEEDRQAVAAGKKYLLNAEPTGAQEIIAARESAKDADELVVVGRIGGDVNPWVEGHAAFSLVDNSLRACSDNPDDLCEMPWDYCCETDRLPQSKLLVKVVDENGALILTDARKLWGLKPLQTIVVQGKAKRDEANNLTVLASGIYVKP